MFAFCVTSGIRVGLPMPPEHSVSQWSNRPEGASNILHLMPSRLSESLGSWGVPNLLGQFWPIKWDTPEQVRDSSALKWSTLRPLRQAPSESSKDVPGPHNSLQAICLDLEMGSR
jgi:hypothetical protein